MPRQPAGGSALTSLLSGGTELWAPGTPFISVPSQETHDSCPALPCHLLGPAPSLHSPAWLRTAVRLLSEAWPRRGGCGPLSPAGEEAAGPSALQPGLLWRATPRLAGQRPAPVPPCSASNASAPGLLGGPLRSPRMTLCPCQHPRAPCGLDMGLVWGLHSCFRSPFGIGIGVGGSPEQKETAWQRPL